VLKNTPGHYEALRLLGAVYLSQHRFHDAQEVGRRARDLRPGDAWNYGVIGDASIELGEYEAAFAAFDQMVRRPSAPRARAAKRELQGNSRVLCMRCRWREEATSAHDPEAACDGWQVAELHLRMGQLADAERSIAAPASVS
jgi:tetratricopeptide (TPR) repeat protein